MLTMSFFERSPHLCNQNIPGVAVALRILHVPTILNLKTNWALSTSLSILLMAIFGCFSAFLPFKVLFQRQVKKKNA